LYKFAVLLRDYAYDIVFGIGAVIFGCPDISLPSLALWQGLNKANCALLDTDRMTALTFLKKEDIPVLGRESLVGVGETIVTDSTQFGN